MKAHIITWALSVVSACIVGAAWIHTHPSPRLARVDMGSLFEEQKKSLGDRIKPGMSEPEQKALLQSATDYAGRVEGALTTLAKECGCAVVNSAAILRVPEAGMAGVPDLSARLRELAAGPK